MRANIIQLDPNLYCIDDAGESTCYLVCGTEKAMLIDTANGKEDLLAIVRTLTDLPLIVVDTHGHPDHILGNGYFEEAWLHPEDFTIAESYFRDRDPQTPPNCPMKPLAIGQRFDLGGTALEVVSLRGHTPGCVGLLERGRRTMFTGDGLNFHMWMQLDHSESMETLRDTLLKVKRDYGSAFDTVLHGHAKGYRDASVLDWQLKACEEILQGKTESDPDHRWFGGTDKRHPISEDPGEGLIYKPERL